MRGARKVLARLDAASEDSVLRIASVVVECAVRERASDIHIRMVGDHCRVFYRVEGVMHEVMRVPDHVHQPLVNRFKILAGLNLSARDVPQDGRFWTEVADKRLDLRVSVVAAASGESLVIRLFDPSCIRLSLDDVHLVGEQREELNKLLSANMGMVCVTGPTVAARAQRCMPCFTN